MKTTSKLVFADAVEEFQEMHGRNLTGLELSLAKHFFRWGAMIIRSDIEDYCTEFINRGRAGCDDFRYDDQGAEDDT